MQRRNTDEASAAQDRVREIRERLMSTSWQTTTKPHTPLLNNVVRMSDGYPAIVIGGAAESANELWHLACELLDLCDEISLGEEVAE